ncbi:GNAT family N-acetyltransferase [Microlunatus soli]|uniref:Acetyltransferase (GNAT) family protein n=1 Tax=Microlunatus soli TaxID=630515 RepID=A0A1H1UKR4_9ACTN|nr:GNAT family N-acetyltransferase [Microlunatus soli]SDS73108.1 Acetyltransferase (GNAT) family protein [Microlunatus soli]
MSAPRYRPLTPSTLSQIADPCEHCGFGFTRRARTDHFGRADERMPQWLTEVTDLWGSCGVSAQLGGEITGYLTYAPAELVAEVALPALGGSSADAFSEDAAVLVNVSVCRAYRGRGIGKELVRTAIAQLHRRQVGLVEVIGTFGTPALPHADGRDAAMTLLPVRFWQAVGFRIVRPHPITPTLRLDIAGTVRWRPDLAAAWSRLTHLVKQPGPAQPAGFQRRTTNSPDTRRLTPAA